MSDVWRMKEKFGGRSELPLVVQVEMYCHVDMPRAPSKSAASHVARGAPANRLKYSNRQDPPTQQPQVQRSASVGNSANR